MTAAKGIDLIGCNDFADIAVKIDRPHQKSVGFILLDRSHPDFKRPQTGGLFSGNDKTGPSETKFSGNPAGNNAGKGT